MCENLQKGDAVMTLNANDEDSDDSSLIFSMDGSVSGVHNTCIPNILICDRFKYNYKAY
jgi:hypothetical protein